MVDCSCSACEASSSAVEETCSEAAEFCWPTLSSCWIAWLICEGPTSCSRGAAGGLLCPERGVFLEPRPWGAQHRPGSLRPLDGFAGQRADFGGRGLAA